MSISKLKDEELLNLVDNDINITNKRVIDNDILLFVANYNIESGKEGVPVGLLYELYTNWSKTPVKLDVFHARMEKLVTCKDTTLYIDKKSIHISKALLVNLQTKTKQARNDTKQLRRHFDIFLKHYDFTKGNNPIKFELLWELYSKWLVVTYRKRGFTKDEFNNLLRLFLKCSITKKGIFYKVSDNVNDILVKENIPNA